MASENKKDVVTNRLGEKILNRLVSGKIVALAINCRSVPLTHFSMTKQGAALPFPCDTLPK